MHHDGLPARKENLTMNEMVIIFFTILSTKSDSVLVPDLDLQYVDRMLSPFFFSFLFFFRLWLLI